MKRRSPTAGRSALALSCVLLLAGCGEEAVTTYRVKREATQAPAAEPSMTSAAPEQKIASTPPANLPAAELATASGELTWTAPAHWKTKAASGMRKASFTVTGENGAEADLSVTAFPGAVGGELANLNRWRGQLQLAPVDEANGAAGVTRETHHGLSFAIVDLTGAGATPSRLLGAMVPVGSATWFFKLSGPDALVGQEKPAFLAFLQTVKTSTP
jgi:hypothetical protein